MKKRGQSKAKLFMAVGIVILFMIGLLYLLYVLGSDYKVNVDGEISDFYFKEDSAFIKLKGGINDGNISEVKFVFRDEGGEEYVYTTSEGASDISVEFDRDFFDWLMRKDKLRGKYDYVFSVSEVEGLNSFEGVVDVSVSFEYETSSREIVNTKPVDVQKINPKKVVSGGSNSGGNSGGGGSSGGSGSSGSSGSGGGCTAKTCGDFSGCGDFDNGCNGVISCGCGEGYECLVGECVNLISQCVPNIEINTNCLCLDVEKSNGYCCSFGWQETICEIFEADYYVDLGLECEDYNVSTRTCGNGNAIVFGVIQKGVDVLQAGDVLVVRGGIYREGIVLKNDGNETDRIVIRNYPGEKVILERTEVLQNWNKCLSKSQCLDNDNWENIYFKNVSEFSIGAFSSFYEGEGFLIPAQTPNPLDRAKIDDFQGFYYRFAPDKINKTEDNLTYIIDSRFEGLGGEKLIGAYISLWVSPNILVNKKILYYNSSENKLIFDYVESPIYEDRESYFSILNNGLSSIFDRQGDFFVDEENKIIYVWPLNGDAEDIVVAGSDRLLSMNAKSHNTVEELVFRRVRGTVVFSEWGNIRGHDNIFKNNEIYDIFTPSETTNTLYFYAVINYTIEGNYLHDNRGRSRGIVVGGTGNILRSNVLERVDGTNLYFGGCKDCAMINNTVMYAQGVHSNALTVYQGSRNILIAGNKVYGSTFGLTLQNSNDTVIYNNLFDSMDMGGYVSADWGGNNGTFYLLNNIFLGSQGNNAIHGRDFYVVKNNIFDVSTQPADNIVSNSYDMSKIFVNAPVAEADAVDVAKMIDDGSNINTRYVYVDDVINYENIKTGHYLVHNADGVVRTIVNNSVKVIHKGNWRTRIEVEPVFENLSNGKVEIWKKTDNFERDYHLKEGSLAIDNGTDITGILEELSFRFPYYDFYKDIEGNPREGVWDVGPYEYKCAVLSSSSFFSKLVKFIGKIF